MRKSRRERIGKMEETKANNARPLSDRSAKIIGFLTLEFLALLCFGFGGENGLVLLRAAGICLALFLYPYAKNQFLLEGGKAKDLLAGIPVLLTCLAFGFSRFWFSFYSLSWINGVFSCLLVSCGLVACFLLGYAVKGLSWVKRDYLFLAIGVGLALLVLISGIYSLVRYGAFYVTAFPKMVYYFEGVVFPLNNEGKILDGFLFREASLRFAKAPAFLLSCFGVGLYGCNPKKDKRFFLILGLAALGFLDMILAPYLYGLILAAAVYAYVGVMYGLRRLSAKGEKQQKAVKICLRIAFYALIASVVGLFLLLVADTVVGESGSFLRRLSFLASKGENNRYSYTALGTLVARVESIIDATFYTTRYGVRHFNFLGLLFGAPAEQILNSPFAEFNFIYQNGMVGFTLLVIALFYGFYRAHRYFYEAEDEGHIKLIAIGLLLGLFAYWSFLADEAPLRHPQGLDEPFAGHQSLLLPFSRSNHMLLATFLYGYIYRLKGKPAPTMKEVA